MYIAGSGVCECTRPTGFSGRMHTLKTLSGVAHTHLYYDPINRIKPDGIYTEDEGVASKTHTHTHTHRAQDLTNRRLGTIYIYIHVRHPQPHGLILSRNRNGGDLRDYMLITLLFFYLSTYGF